MRWIPVYADEFYPIRSMAALQNDISIGLARARRMIGLKEVNPRAMLTARCR